MNFVPKTCATLNIFLWSAQNNFSNILVSNIAIYFWKKIKKIKRIDKCDKTLNIPLQQQKTLKITYFLNPHSNWRVILQQQCIFLLKLKLCLLYKIQKGYKLFDVAKFILVLPTFRLTQQSLSWTRCCMKSLHSVLKLLSNGTQQNYPRLKSAKYKIHVIKEQLLKWMSYNKMK